MPERSRHRSKVAALAVATSLVGASVVGVWASAAGAGGDRIVKSTVTFKPQPFGGRDTRFKGSYPTGYVRSDSQACRQQRGVRLFKKVAGPDQEILSTVTFQVDGYWEYPLPPPLEPGTYYARIERRKIQNTSRSFCSEDRSPDVKVDAP